MDSINIHEAKRRLSKIVARAAEGEFQVPDDFDRMDEEVFYL